jgi:hypothetical protein
MVVVTGHLVGLVVHEGQVDGQHQQQVTNSLPLPILRKPCQPRALALSAPRFVALGAVE